MGSGGRQVESAARTDLSSCKTSEPFYRGLQKYQYRCGGVPDYDYDYDYKKID